MHVDYADGLPARMAQLPVDHAGRPVPKFVEWVDGKPNFRIMNPEHFVRCLTGRYCWVCGQPLGARGVFTIGPMCVINHISAEPPAHLDCAVYSATRCPFLANPEKVRRELNLPAETTVMGGTMIARNPGVTALVVARTWHTVRDPEGGLVVRFTPEEVHWYARGRTATHDEINTSIETGMPFLVDACGDDDRALDHLAQAVIDAERWLP